MVTLIAKQLDLHIIVHPLFLIVVALAILIFAGIMSAILSYHWRKYGVNPVEILKIHLWYYAGLSIFGGLLFFSAVSYALTSTG